MSRIKKASLLLLFFTMGCFVGSIGVYTNFYPFNQVRYLKNVLFGGGLSFSTKNNPRLTIFKEFGPAAAVVMIGDSLTENAEWSEIFPSVVVANRGVSKDGVNEVLDRLETILSVHPKKAFLMVGINNLYNGDTVDSIMKKYKLIVQRLQDENIEVYVQSTVECTKSKCGDVLYRIRELNKKLEEFSVTSDIHFIDINKQLSTVEEGLLDKYTYDGTHLLGEGYLRWRDAISQYVLPAKSIHMQSY